MYEVLIPGFPARCSRGFLGWSTVSLIRTTQGPVMFDTGGAGDRVTLLAALAKRGLSPADIKCVVLSHLHFDHVGNLDCFPEASILLHQQELAHFHTHRDNDPALPVLLVQGLLARNSLQLLNGELEIFPNVRMILTPGHTLGHCSLELHLDGKVHILAQDAVKTRADIGAGEPGQAIDPVLARQSLARIVAIADVIVPGHDAILTRVGGFLPEVGSQIELITTHDNRSHQLEA